LDEERTSASTLLGVGVGALVSLVVLVLVLASALVAGARLRARLRTTQAELARADEALRSNQRSAEAAREVRDVILSSMQDGVLLLDASSNVAYANPALEELLGTRPEGAGTLFPLAVREVAERARTAREAGSCVVETGVPPRWLRVEALPAGREGSVLLVVHDVTEARRLEAVRRDFVANASHELKTPAATIQAAAETLGQASQDDPEAVPRFAAQLEREAVRLSRIVADLLDLSRLESGDAPSERVALDALVREEVQRFEDEVHAAGLALEVDATTSVTVRGSPRDLSLLIRNLIDNAIRYTRPGGSVNVALCVDGAGTATLSISDTGIGLPQRDLSRVFERFYRVDRARSRETGGTGLGLAIVKHVAENHGGHVEVHSELGRGSTFVVTLPASPPPSR
jgi:two-component system, OmpR family, sensor histidine kinase SenX3